jgi:flagella synthesis protein FlgN
MSGPAHDAQIAASLYAECETAARFVALLKEEQQALRDGVIDMLPDLTARKARLADALAEQSRIRHDELRALAHAPDTGGLRAWLAAHPNHARAASAWVRLQALAREARALNDTNGGLIALRLRHFEQALSVLIEACGTETLYGRRGLAVAAPGARTHATA